MHAVLHRLLLASLYGLKGVLRIVLGHDCWVVVVKSKSYADVAVDRRTPRPCVIRMRVMLTADNPIIDVELRNSGLQCVTTKS